MSDVAKAVAAVLAYLLVGAIVGRGAWVRSLRRFGRDSTSLDHYEHSALFRLCLLMCALWWVVLIAAGCGRLGRRLDSELTHVFSQRWYGHVSRDFAADVPAWKCALTRGRQRDDVADLEDGYQVTAPAAGPLAHDAAGEVWAELHTAHCPGCGIVLFRTALVRRGSQPEVVGASPWMPQEHDLIWSMRTTEAGRRALATYSGAEAR